MNLVDALKRRFARPPEPVRAAIAAAGDPDERVLAWGVLLHGTGHLVATSRGLRVVPGRGTEGGAADLLRWHEVGSAKWAGTADGGGSFTVVPLTEVEPGVQARLPEQRYGLSDAGELPAVVRKRVDQTVVTSQRYPLPDGGRVLLVARRLPGQAAKEWTVVFDDESDRDDPVSREIARQRLADALAAERVD